MNTFSILTAQIGMFVIYMLAGVILIRTRVMNRENLEVISKFVIKLALPVMIFINTVNGVERKTLFHSLSIFLIAGIMYICLFLLSYISGIFFHIPPLQFFNAHKFTLLRDFSIVDTFLSKSLSQLYKALAALIASGSGFLWGQMHMFFA